MMKRATVAVERPRSFKLALLGWEAAQQPGVDVLDRDKLFELMDGR